MHFTSKFIYFSLSFLRNLLLLSICFYRSDTSRCFYIFQITWDNKQCTLSVSYLTIYLYILFVLCLMSSICKLFSASWRRTIVNPVMMLSNTPFPHTDYKCNADIRTCINPEPTPHTSSSCLWYDNHRWKLFSFKRLPHSTFYIEYCYVLINLELSLPFT